MFTVDSIWDEAKKIIGNCDDAKFLRILGDVVQLIANKGEFDGWKGWIDICTSGACVTMPREVQTVLGVNIGGTPTLGYDQLFNFHLNGPGDSMPCGWSWQDQGGWHPVYRDLVEPAKLVAYLQRQEDTGSELIVYGYDSVGNKLRRQIGATWYDGYQVPTIYGYAVPEVGAPTVARITAVKKAITAGNVRLSTIDDSGLTGTLLAVYEPDESLPTYRRIKLNRTCNWVRVAYRKTNPVFSSRYDHIPLKNRLAFLLGVRAHKYYSETDLGNAHAFEADAARLELEAQAASEPVLHAPVQVVDLNSPQDKNDYDIR